MRLIDADKLIEEIESYRGDIFANEIVDLIKDMPTVGEWTPADQPPKQDEYLLLSFENFSVPQVGIYREDKDGSGAYYLGDDEVSCSSEGLFVNAWMYLPEPYKE